MNVHNIIRPVAADPSTACQAAADDIVSSTEAVMERLGALTDANLADVGGALKRARDALEKTDKALKALIIDTLTSAGEKRLQGTACKATMVVQNRRTFDTKQLIEDMGAGWCEPYMGEVTITSVRFTL